MAEQPKHGVSFPRLDAVRALCFLSVFVFHSFHTVNADLLAHPVRQFVKGFLFASGDLGVNVFFVLSGFLITFLLLREQDLTGTIHPGHFWLRRLLRIWPLYFACVVFGFLVFPWIKSALGQIPQEHADPWYYLLFAANFDVLRNGLPDASSLAVLWSIGVEEQFYLVWPLLLFALPTRSYPVLFSGVVMASLVFNSFASERLDVLLHTLSCMGDLAMGALGAWFLHRPGGVEQVQGFSPWKVVAAHCSLLLLFFIREPLVASGIPEGILRMVIAMSATIVLLCQSVWKGRACMLPNKGVLSYLGRISFGLYCLHPIGMLVAIHGLAHFGLDGRLWQVMSLQPAIALLSTIALAALSYRFYESPFLRLKSRFTKVARTDRPEEGPVLR